MKKLRILLVSALFALGVGLVATPFTSELAGAAAQKPADENSGSGAGSISPDSGATAKDQILNGAKAADTGGQTDIKVSFKSITEAIMYVLGAISVIVIIIGGILYVTSTGDAAKTKRAKDTILYAVVGLVVAILAFAIVNFVVTEVG